MRKLLPLLLCVLMGSASLSGCTRQSAKPADFLVVGSIYPVYITLLNLTEGVDGVEAKLMTDTQAGCLHDYTLLPGDMKKLESADLFVINGAGMESFLNRVAEGVPGLTVLDASEGIALLEEHGHEEEDAHDGHDHDHDHDGPNPHVWTSVSRYIAQVENIARGLCERDPDRAPLYEKNRDRYLASLRTLQADMQTALSEAPDLRIITFHAAFEYLADDFGLTVEAVIETEPDESPSPRRLVELIELVREHRITAVFAEPQYSSASAKVVARETGCALLTLDPIVTGADNPDAYLEGMRRNTETLLESVKINEQGGSAHE